MNVSNCRLIVLLCRSCSNYCTKTIAIFYVVSSQRINSFYTIWWYLLKLHCPNSPAIFHHLTAYTRLHFCDAARCCSAPKGPQCSLVDSLKNVTLCGLSSIVVVEWDRQVSWSWLTRWHTLAHVPPVIKYLDHTLATIGIAWSQVTDRPRRVRSHGALTGPDGDQPDWRHGWQSTGRWAGRGHDRWMSSTK